MRLAVEKMEELWFVSSIDLSCDLEASKQQAGMSVSYSTCKMYVMGPLALQ